MNFTAIKTKSIYIIFLTSILAVVVGAQIIIQIGLYRQNKDAAHINLAGQQLLLSQQISKVILYINYADKQGNSDEIKINLDTFAKLLGRWRTSYNELLIDAQSSHNTPGIDQMLRENALRLDTILVAGKSMIENPYSLTIQNSVTTVMNMEEPFLKNMTDIVNAYQQEAENKLASLKRVEITLSAITLIILALEFLFIFYPLLKRQQKDNQKLLTLTEELKSARDIAENATRVKSDFLSSMSHEIRTPLNGVIGFSDLLMNTNLDETQRQYMTTVNQSANGLLDIINDVLDFSKIEAGKLELAPEKTNVYELSKQVTDIVRFQAQQKGLKMKLSITESTPDFIWVDAVRLRQVLVNLLGNATKFTASGNVELTITPLSELNESQTLLRFSVRDTGVGIHPENQQKIFQAFSQADASTSKKFGGTGLGLTISNLLLGLMASKLQLDSKPGHGSTFYFDVLLKTELKEQSVENGLSQVTAVKNNVQLRDSAEIKILVAEDNVVNMSLIRIILGNKFPNAQITEAQNGKIALDLFTHEPFNIVFMDVQMPIMNGYEATVAIRDYETKRGNSNRTPIVELTAGAIAGEKEKCLNVGMDDFVGKPIIKAELDRVIKIWL